MILNKLEHKTVNDIDIGYWELKDDQNIFWSEAFLSSLGYSPKDVNINLDFFLDKLVHKDDCKQFRSNFYCFQNIETDFRQSIFIKSKKGKYKEFVCTTNHNFSFNLNKGSKFIFFNKRKLKTNKKVKKNKFYYKETAEMTQTGSWYVDFIKQKSYWDQQTRRILEYPEDYIPSIRNGLKYFADEHKPFAKQNFLGCGFKGKSFNVEIKMLTKNGREFWAKALGKPVFNDQKEIVGIRGVFQNIDTSKTKELNLLRTSNIIASQNKRLFNFAHIVSHNLRSHTSNLTLIVELIESFDNIEEKLDLINNVGDITKSLNETIEHLNEVVTIQTSTNKSKVSVNFNTILNQVKASISHILIRDKTTLISNFSELEHIDYIPAYLESILLNLITNGIKYKHPDRDPEITIKTFVENSKSFLTISDNGIGINLKKYRNKLFGMYNTFHYNKDAVGIGLFITKNQVEALNGKITVNSEVNIGTTFKIEF